MAVILTGTWRFNDILTAPSIDLEQSISFYTIFTPPSYSGEYTYKCNRIRVTSDTTLYYFTVVNILSDGTSVTINSEYPYYNSTNGWDTNHFDARIQTITFTSEQEVSDEFYDWFIANTKRESTEETPVASIIYNGSTIASLLAGQKATLKCKGMKMDSDVVVEAAEHTDNTVGITDVRIEEI